MTKTKYAPICACMVAIMAATLLSAAHAEPGERGDGRRGPPQEAFQACEGKAEGDACVFSGHRGDVEGSCVIPRQEQGELVCAPERGRRHRDSRGDQETG